MCQKFCSEWKYICRVQPTRRNVSQFIYLFIPVRRSTCFRRGFRPSSGAQNCTYSVRYWFDKYLTMYVQFCAPDDGRKNRLKYVERLTEINKEWNVASCWLYSANILAMHGPMNVKLNGSSFLSSVIRKMGFCAGIVHIHQFIKLTYI